MVFGVPEILSPYQYRSIEGSGEAGSEGVMKKKCSVYKTGHVYLIWCINTVRRTGFLLVRLISRRFMNKYNSEISVRN